MSNSVQEKKTWPGEILIKTNKQEQINGSYVRTAVLKIAKLMLYVRKKSPLWLKVNLKISPSKPFNCSPHWRGFPDYLFFKTT